jgi:hypothetical protein
MEDIGRGVAGDRNISDTRVAGICQHFANLEIENDARPFGMQRYGPTASSQVRVGFDGTQRHDGRRAKTARSSLQIPHHGFDSRPRLSHGTAPDLREHGQGRSSFGGSVTRWAAGGG